MRIAMLPVALLGAIGIGLSYAYSDRGQTPRFVTAPIERGRFASAINATGTIEAEVTVYVGSELSGRIAEVFVDYNDAVTVGQPLAQLDRDTFVSRVNEAKAALKVSIAQANVQAAAIERAKLAVVNARTDQSLAESMAAAVKAKQDEAERETQRKSRLAQTGSGSERDLSQARAAQAVGAAELRAALDRIKMKQEAVQIAEADLSIAEASLENAQAVVEQRQAALDQAELDLKRTVLRSPIDGVVISRDVEPGETVAVTLEAKTLFVIVNNLEFMEVHGRIDEADVGKLRVGQSVQFTVDAYPDRTFEGEVLQIRKAPEVVQNVVTYVAVVSAPNPEHLLIPGMTADLRIVVEDAGETLRIPNQALRFQPYEGPGRTAEPSGGPATVWVVGEDGQAKSIRVQVGRSDDTSAELIEGPLAEGQQVIVGVRNAEKRSNLFGFRLRL